MLIQLKKRLKVGSNIKNYYCLPTISVQNGPKIEVKDTF